MTENELSNEYFEWMCQLIYNKQYVGGLSYRMLLTRLNEVEFTYTIPMDGNRAEDGIDLRYRFAYETGHPDSMIALYLDDRPCSILEMMVALSVRLEEHIMDNPDEGDRTGHWFWGMIDNLGLDEMDDMNFNNYYVDCVISRFLNREYKWNGEGGLFTLRHCKKDLRNIDIWYQMCWYLDEILQMEEI